MLVPFKPTPAKPVVPGYRWAAQRRAASLQFESATVDCVETLPGWDVSSPDILVKAAKASGVTPCMRPESVALAAAHARIAVVGGPRPVLTCDTKKITLTCQFGGDLSLTRSGPRATTVKSSSRQSMESNLPCTADARTQHDQCAMALYFYERLGAAVFFAATAPLARRTISGMDSEWQLAERASPVAVFLNRRTGIKVTQGKCAFTLQTSWDMQHDTQNQRLIASMKTHVCSGPTSGADTISSGIINNGPPTHSCDRGIGEIWCPLLVSGQPLWFTRRSESCAERDCEEIKRLYSTIRP